MNKYINKAVTTYPTWSPSITEVCPAIHWSQRCNPNRFTRNTIQIGTVYSLQTAEGAVSTSFETVRNLLKVVRLGNDGN